MAEKSPDDSSFSGPRVVLNRRLFPETVFDAEHLTLKGLKERALEPKHEEYILKTIAPYPRPELHATHLSHSTNLKGLEGIKKDGGFRDPYGSGMVWFYLTMTPEDLRDAATRNMKIVHSYPDFREEDFRLEKVTEQAVEAGLKENEFKADVLKKFSLSPAFSSSSFYGSYRFTFSLKDVLDKYSQQFCSGLKPVMKIWKTVLYIEEVMYAVLVHPPTNQEFSGFPLLPTNRERAPEGTNQEAEPICEFREDPPHYVWRPQAMSETHRFELRQGGLAELEEKLQECYVWDNVAVVLFVDGQELKFRDTELRESLAFCEKGVCPMQSPLPRKPYGYANDVVGHLWPEHSEPLQKFNESEFHIV